MTEALEQALQSQERLANIWDAQARTDEGGVGIPVGCENTNYRWATDAMRLTIALIRDGVTPSEAVKRAKEEARRWIKKHNARRPRDINWQRWEGSADEHIDGVHRAVHNAEKGAL